MYQAAVVWTSYIIYNIYRAHPISQLHHYWSLRGYIYIYSIYIYIQIKVIIWANFGQHLYKQLKVTSPLSSVCQWVNSGWFSALIPLLFAKGGLQVRQTKILLKKNEHVCIECLNKCINMCGGDSFLQNVCICLHMFAWLFNTKKWIPYVLLQAPKM